MKAERGSITIWMLGLSLLLLAFGGLALDFWRGLALQRELAAVADSAAVAAASGIDEVHYRSTGEVILEPGRATGLALRSIDFQDVDLTHVEVTVSPDGTRVMVIISAELQLGLLRALVDDDEPFQVGATATAFPLRLP